MSGGTQPHQIPVTVEWALWGKERSDLEYRLLRCSDGTLSEANFDELLTRYSTGTLEALPQVTIGWLEDRAHGHQIALAIHEEPADRRVDATGRPVVLTRCFCVPYATLAEGRVSYQALYDKFRKIPLHEQEGTFQTSLPVMPSVVRADLAAQRAAALLVTCKPVCVLEADRAGLADRLEFIDSVMSLLPFGLRCQLSASTWASSQFWEHKFRLFFASTLRPDDDCDVIWGGDRRVPTQPLAAGYFDWLRNDSSDVASQLEERATLLASKTDPVRFKAAEVDLSLDELYNMPGSSRRQRSPAPVRRELPAGGRAEWSVEGLLIECADRLHDGAQPVLVANAIRQLIECSDDKATPEEQDRYRRIIKERRLLREDTPLDTSRRGKLYAALLRIAFETPLDYEGYCQLEDCAGVAMHPSLLRAVSQVGTADLWVDLLLAGVDDDEFQALSRAQVPLASLIQAVADLRLEPRHRRVVFETALSEFVARDQSHRLDTQLLRSALAEHGYLASAVERVYQNPQHRLGAVGRVMRLAYRRTLSRADIRTVLSDSGWPPTSELFFTVVEMSDPSDADFAERMFTRGLARQYDQDRGRELILRFPDNGQRDVRDPGPQPAPEETAAQQGLKERIAPRLRPGNTGSHVLHRLPTIQVPARRHRADRGAPSPGLPQKVNWVRVIILSIVFVALLCFLFVYLTQFIHT